jgi:predicted RNA-binding protein
MRSWFCVTNPYNWLIVKRERLWGLDYRYEITLRERVREGDLLAFYVFANLRTGLRKWITEQKRKGLVNADELETSRGCFVGVWRVSGPYFEDKEHIGWVDRDGQPAAYPHRRRIFLYTNPPNPVSLNPDTELFMKLIFITDKTSSWYNILYSSMTLISEEDMNIFVGYCKAT